MINPSTPAYELAKQLETTPMLALGVVLMPEQEFVEIALRAKRILVAKASKDRMITNDEFIRMIA